MKISQPYCGFRIYLMQLLPAIIYFTVGPWVTGYRTPRVHKPDFQVAMETKFWYYLWVLVMEFASWRHVGT
jgi:hypothetical protein